MTTPPARPEWPRIPEAQQRVERQHANGIHTDCARATCEWWSPTVPPVSPWVRRALAGDLPLNTGAPLVRWPADR